MQIITDIYKAELIGIDKSKSKPNDSIAVRITPGAPGPWWDSFKGALKASDYSGCEMKRDGDCIVLGCGPNEFRTQVNILENIITHANGLYQIIAKGELQDSHAWNTQLDKLQEEFFG